MLTKDTLSGACLTRIHDVLREHARFRKCEHVNLDAIIAVGYRVNSRRATQFRIWATQVLREYIIKGFALNDERMKQGGTPFGKDYFRELLERVQAIRASERRIWQQITDIFAECSIDYDKDSEVTRDFYGMVQNKFHYTICGETATEIIHNRVNREKPNLGLTPTTVSSSSSPISTSKSRSSSTALVRGRRPFEWALRRPFNPSSAS